MKTFCRAISSRTERRRSGTRGAGTMLLLAFLLLAASGCRPASPETQLREDVAALETAIEARDAGAVAGFLAEDFVGPGGLDRAGARRLAALHFLRHRDVGVATGPLDVALQGDHATVGGNVVLTGGAGGLVPRSGDFRQVTTGWRLRDGEWRMTSIDWGD